MTMIDLTISDLARRPDDLGYTAIPATPWEFSKTMRAEARRYDPIVKSAKIQAEEPF